KKSSKSPSRRRPGSTEQWHNGPPLSSGWRRHFFLALWRLGVSNLLILHRLQHFAADEGEPVLGGNPGDVADRVADLGEKAGLHRRGGAGHERDEARRRVGGLELRLVALGRNVL